MNFSVDPFANNINAKCAKFYSKFACPNTSGINGLNFSWKDEVVWAVPPVKLLSKTICHMQNCKVQGVVVFPEWKSLPIWPLLENAKFKTFLKRYWTYPGKLYLTSNDKRCIFNETFRGNLRICFFDFRQSN